jgi:DNA-directed RNA polymerase subunit RPC12/RpoP
MALAKTRHQAKAVRPWWLDDSEESCPACGHTYVIQTEYRCVACDGAVCSLCVASILDTEILCPDCVTAKEFKE